MKTAARSSAVAGLGFAALLGLALLLLSYLRLAALLKTDAFHNPKVVAETLTEPLWHTQLGFNILMFVLAQLALHFAFGASCLLLALASERAWPKAKATRRQWILVWFVLGALCLLIMNASYFPRSSLGAPYKAIGHVALFGVTPSLFLSTCVVTGAAVTILLALFRTLGPRRMVALGVGAAVMVATTGFLLHATVPHANPVPSRPNVIVLGIDSLRPDMATTENTPYMRAFLDQSLQLTDAVTPLARTFPSWVSILTGRHPHTTGAFMNLLPRDLIREGSTLPSQLREKGYRAVYAIDETRFSNVDASYGFDRALTPPIGGSDFVLAWFSDTPLSNVVMNTWLGALLFPYQYANRAAFVTYDPDSFVKRVERGLDTRQPLFLALHLTLPHWPFEWADSALPREDQAPTYEAGTRWKYINASHRADKQFGDLLALLERKGLLANAIVVALSDHGEAFGAEDEFLTEALPGEEESVISAQEKGHGTSVFSPRQYHTVLGFRAYGAAAGLLPAPRAVDGKVSLLDIVPTILDLLKMPATQPLDGMSLLPLFRDEPAAAERFADRIRFTESEYNPGGFDTSNMTASALAAAATVYRVDPRTDRLQVRAELVKTILSTRQYAALLGDSFAAAVPKDTGGNPYRFVYEPAAGRVDPKEEARLRDALEKRFDIQFGNLTTEVKSKLQ
ncbi:MAG: sulfatase-like hydrolase/transferase [Pseudomonadota bacterium]